MRAGVPAMAKVSGVTTTGKASGIGGPRRASVKHPPRIVFVLEHQHRIIGVPDFKRPPPKSRLGDRARPNLRLGALEGGAARPLRAAQDVNRGPGALAAPRCANEPHGSERSATRRVKGTDDA